MTYTHFHLYPPFTSIENHAFYLLLDLAPIPPPPHNNTAIMATYLPTSLSLPSLCVIGRDFALICEREERVELINYYIATWYFSIDTPASVFETANL
jgi:hypothetical protein